MVEREDIVEASSVVGAVALFVVVLLVIGATYGATAPGPSGSPVVTSLPGDGGLYVVGAIVLFLLSSAAAGYWVSTR